MARTVEQWTDDLARSLKQVPEELRRAKAAELVRGTQAFQRNAPRGGKRLRSGAARGYPSLYRSIKTERAEAALYTEHPGAELLEHGGIVRPVRRRFLAIPLRRDWFGASKLVTIPLSGGRLAVLSPGKAAKRVKLMALLVPYVAIRARRWISRSVTETAQGSEDRIADAVLRGEATGG